MESESAKHLAGDRGTRDIKGNRPIACLDRDVELKKATTGLLLLDDAGQLRDKPGLAAKRRRRPLGMSDTSSARLKRPGKSS